MRVIIGKCLLLYLLEKKGWTQTHLSDLSGVSKQRLNDYIHNRKTMSLETAKLLAEHLGCSIDDLYVWIYKRKQ